MSKDDFDNDVRQVQLADEVQHLLKQARYTVLYQKVHPGKQVVRIVDTYTWMGRMLRIRLSRTYVSGPDGWAVTTTLDGHELIFTFAEPFVSFDSDAWMVEHDDGTYSIHCGTMQPIQLLTTIEAQIKGFPVR